MDAAPTSITSLATERLTLAPDASRLRLQTTIRLRWFAVIGQMIVVVLVYFGLGFDLPMGWCLLLIAASAWLNIRSEERRVGKECRL